MSGGKFGNDKFDCGVEEWKEPGPEKELPAGCDKCNSTFPCEDTCGSDPFANKAKTEKLKEI